MKILLGVTGGIAAYKAADLGRSLAKRGHTVRCCLTEAGSRFITQLLTVMRLKSPPDSVPSLNALQPVAR